MKNFKLKSALMLFVTIGAALLAFSGLFHPAEAFGSILAFAPAARPGASMRPIYGPDKARVSLEEFRLGMRDKGIVITPGYIQDDVLLSNAAAVGAINFTTTQIATGSTPTSTAQRLANNDAFLVTDIGIFIGTAVAVGGVSTAAQQAAMRLETFPNPLVLTLAAADAIALGGLYNGWLSIKESSTTYFEQIPARRFYRVGMAQRGTLLFTASNQMESTWDGPNYGMVPITPQFKMAGNKGYQISLNLPQSITITQATTLNIYASLRFYGYKATGGAAYAQ